MSWYPTVTRGIEGDGTDVSQSYNPHASLYASFLLDYALNAYLPIVCYVKSTTATMNAF